MDVDDKEDDYILEQSEDDEDDSEDKSKVSLLFVGTG
jgi:hypothetical protein